jgi:RimJ/RimL family protein N-acetyltransferase
MSWPPAPHTELAAGTVSLRPFVADDTIELFNALHDDRVWKHVAGRPGSAEALALSLIRSTSEERVTWVVRLQRPLRGLPAGSVVGTSTYLDPSPRDARLEIGSTAYSPAVWGTSVNPQTKLLLLGHAFDELGAGRVQLKTDVRNARSQEAIARLGATYEGTLRRYQRRADGTVRDTVLFSITAEEWPGVREGLVRRLA